MYLKQIFNLFILTLFLQNNSMAQENSLSVNSVLEKAEKVFSKTPYYSLDIAYKSFGNYTTNEVLESFSGNIVKQNRSMYLKIHNTIFVTDEEKQLSLKLFETEKVIEISNQIKEVAEKSPLQITDFIKLFKYRKVEDKGDYYLCSLSTDVVTQLPYGSVQLYITKKDFLITKQVMYFLAKYPYLDKNGEERKGTPRLEVLLSNFKKQIPEDSKGLTNVSHYIVKKGSEFIGSKTYRDFTIVQN